MNIHYEPKPVPVHPVTVERRRLAAELGIQKRVWPKDRTPLGSFMEKICYAGDCIIWTGLVNGNGYGVTSVSQRSVYAHRFAYQQQYGPIPKGLQIDHLCRNPICVNPAHLEAVTPKINTYRSNAPKIWKAMSSRTHCNHGHELTADNIRFQAGYRRCRTCMRNEAKRGKIARRLRDERTRQGS